MKNRLGNPTFLVRLEPNEEKTLIGLANKFGKDSYPKTIVSVAMVYESEKRELQTRIVQQSQEIRKLKQLLSESNKKNTALMSKMSAFVKLVDKIADIKPTLRIFRDRSTRLRK